MNIVGRILSYLVPFKKRIFFAVIILIIAISIGFLQPLVIQRITDIGMVQKNMNAIFQSAVFLGFLVILNQLIEMLQTKIFVEIHNQSLYSIFHQTFQKLIHLKRSYFDDKNTTEILNFLQINRAYDRNLTVLMLQRQFNFTEEEAESALENFDAIMEKYNAIPTIDDRLYASLYETVNAYLTADKAPAEETAAKLQASAEQYFAE